MASPPNGEGEVWKMVMLEEESTVFPLSHDLLIRVFGSLCPFDLSRLLPVLPAPLVIRAFTHHTHMTINGSAEAGERRLWEDLQPSEAFTWGRRAVHLRELRVVLPNGAPRWCMAVWMAVLEGHAEGRRQLAGRELANRVRSVEDRGTLRVLAFSRDAEGEPYPSGNTVSADPLSPPQSPVGLPALEEVVGMPLSCALLRHDGRHWSTPGLSVLRLDNHDEDTTCFGHQEHDPSESSSLVERALRPWLSECHSLEAVDEDFPTHDSNLALKTEIVSLLPKRRSLSRLRELGSLQAYNYMVHQVDQLRDALVARGCHRSVRSVPIELGCHLALDDIRYVEHLAGLSMAVMTPEALWGQPQIISEGGEIDAAVIKSVSSQEQQEEGHQLKDGRAALVAKYVREYACAAVVVRFSFSSDAGGDVLSRDKWLGVFPVAESLIISADEADNNHSDSDREDLRVREAVSVAASMPALTHVTFKGGVRPSLVVRFLTALQSTHKGHPLRVTVLVTAESLADGGLCAVGRKMPLIDRLDIVLLGSVPPSVCVGDLFNALRSLLFWLPAIRSRVVLRDESLLEHVSAHLAVAHTCGMGLRGGALVVRRDGQ
ncbi:unnamed protein product [Vitrella brassicaformis CCMP3155]|uniref:Uncharacterized protein n=2 Tax=Vitrella brassicaformis TaxID=1169539 RepID=A0A0G4EPQ8_VITBC|nr:unnamed protein product [Vitrella brassicaformis CCMP3155]|eukprot:CEL99813.1 unnamed protein product [Vitrella brassicaformis CCMP3155]